MPASSRWVYRSFGLETSYGVGQVPSTDNVGQGIDAYVVVRVCANEGWQVGAKLGWRNKPGISRRGHKVGCEGFGSGVDDEAIVGNMLGNDVRRGIGPGSGIAAVGAQDGSPLDFTVGNSLGSTPLGCPLGKRAGFGIGSAVGDEWRRNWSNVDALQLGNAVGSVVTLIDGNVACNNA